MPTYAADDVDVISARLKELAAERDAARQAPPAEASGVEDCGCVMFEDAFGNQTRSWHPNCQLHRPGHDPD